MENYYSKKSIYRWILLYVAIGAIAYSFIYYLFFTKDNYYQNNNQIQNSETTGWKTYKNDKHGYEVEYPKDWTFREFPNTKDGAGFRPSSAPENVEDEIVVINLTNRGLNYCDIPFNEYVGKFGATVEIQDYEKLYSIEEITTYSNLIGYKTTWYYNHFGGGQKISLPITYFNSNSEDCKDIQIYLNNDNYMETYNKMIYTFKFTK